MVLYNRYKTSILSYLSTFRLSDDQSEQIAQDAFIKVYQKIDQFQPTYSFKSWLWSITRNTAIDYQRKKDALNFIADLSDDSPSYEELSIEYNNAETQFIVKSTELQINKCLEKLKDSHKEILSLRVFSELSYDEIAELTGHGLGKIKTIIHRSKIALKKCISDKENSDE